MKYFTEKELLERCYTPTDYVCENPSYSWEREVLIKLNLSWGNHCVFRMENQLWQLWLKPDCDKSQMFKDISLLFD